MIVTELIGGLGNQLFQYAVGRCIAYKNNTELKLDLRKCGKINSSHHAFYQLDKFNIKENFASPEDISNTSYIKALPDNKFTEDILNAPDNIFLSGYWQNEKYFLEIEDIIRREFTLKNPLEKNSAAWKEKILSAQCSVSLHVRHGDYLLYKARSSFGVLSAVYYYKCIAELKKDYPNLTVFVFSDDLQWCKENLKFDVATEFVEGCEHNYEELYLMSICKHNIIANSTFAWWGAWLNQNPDKKVFVPNLWHREKVYFTYFESCMEIPVDYSLWTPLLSIIVCIEDDLPLLKISLPSIVAQDFTDYEIIFTDNSTNNSGNFCRQFSGKPNVTILKTEPSLSKFAAWNKALEVARGDYVLFLTGNEFIFPQTTSLLANICDRNILNKMTITKSYVTCQNLNSCTPNIICFTRYLEEAEDENLDITDIQNKKFFVKSDSAFKNLNYVIELNISVKDKLMTLANEFINNSMGTKFFKRSFLNENNIRFRTGGVWTQTYSSLSKRLCVRKKLCLCRKSFTGGLNKFLKGQLKVW